MILNQPTAVIAKRTQVGIRCIQYRTGLDVTELDIGIEIQRPEIPVRLLEDGLPIICVSKKGMQCRNPCRPAAWNSLGTHGPSGEDLLTCTGVFRAVVNLSQCGDLPVCQTI